MKKANIKYIHQYVKDFVCMADSCPDTCCKDWDMVVDDKTKNIYKANPELTDLLQEKDGKHIIQRDKEDYCKKYEQGICSLHKNHGSDILSDVCHFYPRIYRQVAEGHVLSATMSCPEIARLILYSKDALQLNKESPLSYLPERLPFNTTSHNGVDFASQEAVMVYENMLNIVKRQDSSATDDLALIWRMSGSLNYIKPENWQDALSYLNEISPALISKASAYQPLAPFHLLLSVVNIVKALTVKRPSSRLLQTISEIEYLLEVSVDWQRVSVDSYQDEFNQQEKLANIYLARYHDIDAIMKKWLLGRLSTSFFPFSGIGNNILERGKIIIVHFAITRLALMALYNLGIPTQKDIIRVVQSLSRHLEHLSDPTYSLSLYKEFNWNQDSELQSLIMGEAPEIIPQKITTETEQEILEETS